VEGLAKAGLKPLRVGFNGNIQKSLIEHSLDHKLEVHPLHPTLVRTVNEAEKVSRQMQDLPKALKELSKKLWEAKNPKKSMIERERNMRNGLISIRNQHKHLQQKIYAIQQEMLRDTVAAADVVSGQI
jgi:regulator of nonsense transcripts 1